MPEINEFTIDLKVKKLKTSAHTPDRMFNLYDIMCKIHSAHLTVKTWHANIFFYLH